jgi:nitrile hydratase
MDGVHDLGGSDGFGAIAHTDSEPTFHEEWEKRAFAMVLLTMGHREYTMDEFRHAIERMEPAWYLDSPYFGRWLAAMEKLLVENGTLSASDLSERIRSAKEDKLSIPERQDPALAEKMRSIIESGGGTRRGDGDPQFEIGETVRVKNSHPEGHTRCPGYVRRTEGTVEEIYGSHVFPDSHAHGEGESPEPLYSIRFEGETLWGDAAEPNTAVSVDLWESYLREP